MELRDAYERRAWRLAFLLTGGRAEHCPRIISTVLDAQPDLRRLDAAHLDRLVVLSARRWVAGVRGRGGRPMTAQSSGHWHELLLWAAAELPRQQLEAWVLMRVDGLELMAAAKAMDCSKTATQRHLEHADKVLGERFGARLGGMLRELAAVADRQAPGPALAQYRASRRRRRRIRAALVVMGIVAVAGVVGVVWMWQ